MTRDTLANRYPTKNRGKIRPTSRITSGKRRNRGRSLAAQQGEHHQAGQGHGKGEAEGQGAHLLHFFVLPLAVGQAEQRLAAIADALEQQHHDGADVAHRRIVSDGGGPAHQSGAFVDEDQGDVGGDR